MPPLPATAILPSVSPVGNADLLLHHMGACQRRRYPAINIPWSWPGLWLKRKLCYVGIFPAPPIPCLFGIFDSRRLHAYEDGKVGRANTGLARESEGRSSGQNSWVDSRQQSTILEAPRRCTAASLTLAVLGGRDVLHKGVQLLGGILVLVALARQSDAHAVRDVARGRTGANGEHGGLTCQADSAPAASSNYGGTANRPRARRWRTLLSKL